MLTFEAFKELELGSLLTIRDREYVKVEIAVGKKMAVVSQDFTVHYINNDDDAGMLTPVPNPLAP